MFDFFFLYFVFFFQGEDGIRDVAVTGVQTCALPICGDNWCFFLLMFLLLLIVVVVFLL